MTKNIYRRSSYRRAHHWIERVSYLGAGFGVLLIAVVCYFKFFVPVPLPEIVQAQEQMRDQGGDTHPDGVFVSAADAVALLGGADDVSEEFAAQDLPMLSPDAQLEDAQPDDDPNLIQGKIAAGDTVGTLLQQWIGASGVHAIAEACKDVFPLNRIRIGQPYSVHLEGGRLLRFEYEVNNDRRLVVTRELDGEKVTWEAQLEKIEYEIHLVRVEGEITSNLFVAMAAAGEEGTLASHLADIFAWEINFIRDLRVGDSFRLLVEKRYRDGKFGGYGTIHAAEFVNRNSKFEAYVFKGSDGKNDYFNAAGDSLKRAFLKAPLSFTRVSSRFSPARLHPIHKTVRPHNGVDYAAPTGTPIMAIGRGEVIFRGFNQGAGNYVTLRHANGYESQYLHMSRFAAGLKKGDRVSQGQVIGYVGSTGYATGPHVCFRIKQNGKFLNPEKVLSPRDESVSQKQLAAFKADRDRWRSYLQGEIALIEYSREKENL